MSEDKKGKDFVRVQVKVPVKLYKKVKRKLFDDEASWQDVLLKAVKRYGKKST